LLSPKEASLRARIGAFAQHAKHDPRQTTVAARTAFDQRFIQQVDPNGELAPEERARRADAARRQYFTALAFRRARKRSAAVRFEVVATQESTAAGPIAAVLVPEVDSRDVEPAPAV